MYSMALNWTTCGLRRDTIVSSNGTKSIAAYERTVSEKIAIFALFDAKNETASDKIISFLPQLII